MRSINRIYKILAELEEQLIEYKKLTLYSDGYSSLADTRSRICDNLRELSTMLANADSTVQCADFQFMGKKFKLAYIIALANQFIQ